MRSFRSLAVLAAVILCIGAFSTLGSARVDNPPTFPPYDPTLPPVPGNPSPYPPTPAPGGPSEPDFTFGESYTAEGKLHVTTMLNYSNADGNNVYVQTDFVYTMTFSGCTDGFSVYAGMEADGTTYTDYSTVAPVTSVLVKATSGTGTLTSGTVAITTQTWVITPPSLGTSNVTTATTTGSGTLYSSNGGLEIQTYPVLLTTPSSAPGTAGLGYIVPASQAIAAY